MRPYLSIRLTQWPDMADLKAEGRKAAAGNLRGRNGRDIRGLFRHPRVKRAVRRTLKRIDRRRVQAQAVEDMTNVLD